MDPLAAPAGTTTFLRLPAYGVAVSRTGIIATADNHHTVWIREGDSTGMVVVGYTPVHLAFSSKGDALYVTSMGGWLFRIDVATRRIVDSARFRRPVYNVAVRPADGRVYVTTGDGWLLKVAPDGLAVLDSVRLASASNGVAFTADGTTLWASTIEAGVLYRIDPRSLDKVDSFPLGGQLQRLAVAPSGDSVYVADQARDQLHIVRPRTRTVRALRVSGIPHGVGISADGSWLVVAQFEGRVTILDRRSLRVLTVVPVAGSPRNIAAVPGGGVLVSTEGDVVRVQ